jgi:hypothetical protein
MKKFCVLLSLVIVLVALGLGCSKDSTTFKQGSAETEKQQCVQPQNPYNDGGGHDAGFNWAAENGGGCNGNSDSFNEGCEEYHRQMNKYNECVARNSK